MPVPSSSPVFPSIIQTAKPHGHSVALNSFQCSRLSLPPETLFSAGAPSASQASSPRPLKSDLPSQSSLSGVQFLGASPHSVSCTQPRHRLCGLSSAWLFLRHLFMQMPRGSDQPSPTELWFCPQICCPAAVLVSLWLPPPSLPPPVSGMVRGPVG